MDFVFLLFLLNYEMTVSLLFLIVVLLLLLLLFLLVADSKIAERIHNAMSCLHKIKFLYVLISFSERCQLPLFENFPNYLSAFYCSSTLCWTLGVF